MPEYRFEVPAQLAAPGAFYARAMALSSHSAWFILTLRMGDPIAPCETFLLVWDHDVVNVIKTAPGKLEALMFVRPLSRGGKIRWVTKQISEVWEATDCENAGESCVLMVGADGREYSGYFMSPARGVRRQSLVARAPAPAPAQPLND